MHDTTWETYRKEFALIDSLKYTDRRLMNEVELSSLISSLHELLYEVLNPQLTSEKMHIFSEIDEYCIDTIKCHHKKTEYLNNREFLVWHLSIFMVIQTFVEIIESKYKLEQKEEIKHTFEKLVKTDFYKFITLNCEVMKIDNITDNLLVKAEL